MNDTAIDLIAERLVNGPKECQIEMQYQLALQEAEKNEQIKKLNNKMKYDSDIYNAKIIEQQKRIEALEELKTPPRSRLWFSLGLITGVGTTIAIAKAVQ
jgi:hypothetical protein